MKEKKIKFKRIRIKGDGSDALPKKRRRLKYIAVLPSFITLLNGVCGFVAIIFASQSPIIRWNLSFVRRVPLNSLTLAAYLIILAMIADMLDGRVARLTRTTSSFGGQLDSLSDAISFGVAPAFIMIKLAQYYLETFRSEYLQFSVIVGRGLFFTAIFYVMCALVRLARFNVENDEDESAHMNFSGLPSPAAAGVVVSLVIFQQQIVHSIGNQTAEIFRVMEILTVTALPLITLITGLLMVTRIRYPHAANQLFRGKKTLPVFLGIVAVILLAIWNIQLALVIGFCGFALFGIIRGIIATLFRKPKAAAAQTPEPQASEDKPAEM